MKKKMTKNNKIFNFKKIFIFQMMKNNINQMKKKWKKILYI